MRTFKNQWIGWIGHIPLPACSPDLNAIQLVIMVKHETIWVFYWNKLFADRTILSLVLLRTFTTDHGDFEESVKPDTKWQRAALIWIDIRSSILYGEVFTCQKLCFMGHVVTRLFLSLWVHSSPEIWFFNTLHLC